MTDKKEDRLVLGAVQPDGSAPYVRVKDGTVERGTAVATKEGRPIGPEAHLVSITRRPDEWWDVSEYQDVSQATAAITKPAKVTSRAYRSGWDTLWGAKPSKDMN